MAVEVKREINTNWGLRHILERNLCFLPSLDTSVRRLPEGRRSAPVYGLKATGGLVIGRAQCAPREPRRQRRGSPQVKVTHRLLQR